MKHFELIGLFGYVTANTNAYAEALRGFDNPGNYDVYETIGNIDKRDVLIVPNWSKTDIPEDEWLERTAQVIRAQIGAQANFKACMGAYRGFILSAAKYTGLKSYEEWPVHSIRGDNNYDWEIKFHDDKLTISQHDIDRFIK